MTKTPKLPSTWQVMTAIGRVTVTEIIRDKILYNIFLITVLLLGLAILTSRLSFISPHRIVLDFGISAINLSGAAIAALMGAGLITRELERRTIYVALSHPISKAQFILGKFYGLACVIAINWVLLSLVFLGILGWMAPTWGDVLNVTLFLALFLLLIQSFLIAGIAIFFSTLSTTSLSVMFTVGVYLIGNNISQLRLIAVRMREELGGVLLNTLSFLLPNLEYFNLGTKVTYGLPLTWSFVMTSMGYGLVWIVLVLFLSGFLIRFKEI